MSDADAQLLLKKRARRRLVGAIAFVLFAAVVLPMVMDASPPLPAQEVQIRIPGQEQPIFTPPAPPAKSAATAPAAPTPAPTAEAKPAATPDAPTPANAAAAAAPVVVAAAAVAASAKTPESKPADKKAADKPADKPIDKPAAAEKHADKPAEKAADKPADKTKPAEKKDEKKDEKKAEKDKKPDAKKGEGDRAAAILAGKPAAAAGAQVILIGAYANPGNVKVLRAKLDQIGVKTYTENLSSPQGNKTRLRAGPFANKEAAEKALEKMKHIGVSGVIAAK